MKPFEGSLEPLQQSKKNLLLFKSLTQKGRGPTFTEPQLCRRGRHFLLMQQPSVSQAEERTSTRILIGLSFPGVDRETCGTEIAKKRWLCAHSKSPSLFSVQKIPKEASNSAYFPLHLLSLTCSMPEATVRWVSFGGWK